MRPFADPEIKDVVRDLQKCEATLALIRDFLFNAIGDDDTAWEPDREAFTGLAHVADEVWLALGKIVANTQMKYVEEMVRVAAENRTSSNLQTTKIEDDEVSTLKEQLRVMVNHMVDDPSLICSTMFELSQIMDQVRKLKGIKDACDGSNAEQVESKTVGE